MRIPDNIIASPEWNTNFIEEANYKVRQDKIHKRRADLSEEMGNLMDTFRSKTEGLGSGCEINNEYNLSVWLEKSTPEKINKQHLVDLRDNIIELVGTPIEDRIIKKTTVSKIKNLWWEGRKVHFLAASYLEEEEDGLVDFDWPFWLSDVRKFEE